MRIAVFVSPHGFGHAARSCAVLEALADRRPGLGIELFTTVPKWFFDDSLDTEQGKVDLSWNDLVTDVGLVQRSSVEEDLAATAELVETFVGSLDGQAEILGSRLRELGCSAVLADISPLGLAAAQRAGLPSALIENFTWEWIYAAYREREPRLRALGDRLAECFRGADLRLRATPAAPLATGYIAEEQEIVELPPVVRRSKLTPGEVRDALGVAADRPLVLLTMGGVSWNYSHLDRLGAWEGGTLAVLSGVPEVERRGSLVLLPDRSPIPVPDLVSAADAVVGKLGYNTVAEAWSAGTRFLYVPRPIFPESAVLESFVQANLPCAELPVEALREGRWLDPLEALLALPRAERRPAVGADRAAERILERWG